MRQQIHSTVKAIDLKLEYRGRSWLTVPMEIGHDELGDTETPELRLADDSATSLSASASRRRTRSH